MFKLFFSEVRIGVIPVTDFPLSQQYRFGIMANGYVCTLDQASLLKAEQELNEDPKQRMSAVETLRKWLEERKDWVRVPTGESLDGWKRIE